MKFSSNDRARNPAIDPGRRRFALGGSLLLATSSASAEQNPGTSAAPMNPPSSDAAAADPTFVDYWSDDRVAQRLDNSVKGVKLPLDRDIQVAQKIIAKAPASSPLAVMAYFADLKERGTTGELFNSRWKNYENPVIVWFFHATQTKPTGDCTSWCAAFLSWTLERCGLPSVHSASSQAYAKFAAEAEEPKAGDVVVFQDVSDTSHGHVALLLSRKGDTLQVIGGNQGNAGVIAACPGYPVSQICRAQRSAKGDHGQTVRTYRRYT